MKRKTFLLFAVFILLVAGCASVIATLLGINRQYINKETAVTAAEINLNNIFSATDSEDVFNFKVTEMTEYFHQNGINTAVISFNDGQYAVSETAGFNNQFDNAVFNDDEDILKALKKPLEKENIQIILKIDCTALDFEQLNYTISEINRKYAFAGVLLENYTLEYSFLQTLKMNINKRMQEYFLGIRLDNTDTAREVQIFGAVDFYIFDNITEAEYRKAKKADFSNETILLDYKAESFVSDLFMLSNFGGYDGLLFTEYTNPEKDLSFYHNIKDATVNLEHFNFTVDNTFSVIYPSQNMETDSGAIYITGTASPAQSVTVNGVEITPAADGTFGYYMELAEGENLVEVSQGENYISRIVTKNSYKKSTVTKKQSDETKKAKKGQIVQTTEELTSLLASPDSDSSIVDGLQYGVQMVVTKSVRTTRNGKYTWAYELSNGNYVLAQSVEWITEKEYIPSSVSGFDIEKLENGDEYLVINSTGKPAVVSYQEDDTVTFEIIDSQINDDFVYTDAENKTVKLDSVFGENCTVEAPKDSVYITLNNTGKELWGYNIEYCEDGTIKIYLKNAPGKTEGAKPLTGVSVMLDAGHGGKDPGALPLYGVKGPGEQDINLAIAQATKACLEKLGATVTLTREDDTYLTLGQRRDITNSVKPDLFIAIHHNSMEYTVNGSEQWGVESYYFTPQSKSVAEIMTERISYVTDRVNRGHYWGYYYVIRNDIAPSVLNEYGFVMNPYEYSTLYSNENIYRAAMGTALAVLDIIPE